MFPSHLGSSPSLLFLPARSFLDAARATRAILLPLQTAPLALKCHTFARVAKWYTIPLLKITNWHINVEHSVWYIYFP